MVRFLTARGTPILCFVALLAGPTQAQITWHVDRNQCVAPGSGSQIDPFCVIQDAISAASDADQVHVAQGTYDEVIDFQGKAITVRSTGGASVTTINGAGFNDSVVKCVHSAGVAAVFEGFTVTGGTGAVCPSDPEKTCGGGIQIIGGAITVSACVFQGNSASYGGGVYSELGCPKLLNNSFVGNSAEYGGGLYDLSEECSPYLSSISVINCTFATNNASVVGGGMYGRSDSAELVGSILWGNTIAGSAPNQIAVDDQGRVFATSCDMEGGFPGSGILDADPLFVRAPDPHGNGWDGLDDDFGDLRLQAGSPCVDSGGGAFLPDETAVDLGGASRFVDVMCVAPNAVPGVRGPVDIGAFEFQVLPGCDDGVCDAVESCTLCACDCCCGDGMCGVWETCASCPSDCVADGPVTYFVDQAASGGVGDGSSWEDAFLSLSIALDSALCGTEIRVAQGVYTPNASELLDPQTATFQIPDGVTLLGGFAGLGAANPDERDSDMFETILSGDLAGDDSTALSPTSNCCAENKSGGCDDAACMELVCSRYAFCCTKTWDATCASRARGVCCDACGEQMFCENAYHVVTINGDRSMDVTLDGFTISAGRATRAETRVTPSRNYGGGLLALGVYAEATLNVRDCRFVENAAVTGAAVTVSDPWLTPPTFTQCEFVGNSGSAFFVDLSYANLIGCRFIGNRGLGGDNSCAFLLYSGFAHIESSLFSGNEGVGICGPGSWWRTDIVNSTIVHNQSTEAVAGIWGGQGTFCTNCIVWGNVGIDGDDDFAQVGLTRMSQSIVQGWTGNFIGTGISRDDPHFVDPVGPDGTVGTGDEDYRILHGWSSTETGDNSEVVYSFDADGALRIVDGDDDGEAVVDLGAFESQLVCAPASPFPAEPDLVAKNRYVSFVPLHDGASAAIEITLQSGSNFPEAVTKSWWAGPPQERPEEDADDPGRMFFAASLQCEPYFTNWNAIDTLHVHGAEIVPSATYRIRSVSADCGAGLPLDVDTGAWGDVVAPFNTNGDEFQPDFRDIDAVVSKFLGTSDAPMKAAAQLQPNVALSPRPIDFKDVAVDVQAFLGTLYTDMPFATGPCDCPSAVVCGVADCTTDTQCTLGFCIGGFCTDSCGRCSP